MGSWGFDVSGMDRTARPGEDFFRFASGNWARTTEIPTDRSSFGAFNALRDLSEARVRRLVEGYRANDTANPEGAKVAQLYRSFMDERRVNALGARPLEPLIGRCGKRETRSRSRSRWGAPWARWAAPFSELASTTTSRIGRVRADLRQSGLGLPDRDYYLEERFAPQKGRYGFMSLRCLNSLAGSSRRSQPRPLLCSISEIARAHCPAQRVATATVRTTR
jgi:putative endopeptidase